jgi:tetratricopeptide (TPR) repeat protein
MKKLLLYSIPVLLLLVASCMPGSAEEESPVALNEQGIQLINHGKHEEALQLFLKAIKSSNISKDTRGTIYRNIALTYNQLDKKDSAIHFSTLAAKCYRKNSYDYLVNAADVDLLRRKTAPALTKLLRAVDIDPDEMAVNNSLGLLYLGEYGESFTDLDKALTYNLKAFDINGSRNIEEVLALNYYKLENYEKAELHYEHLHQVYPDMISYTLDMGMAKYKLKDKTEANKLFDEVIFKDSSYKATIDLFKENNR